MLNCDKIFVISHIWLEAQLLHLETFMSNWPGHVGVPGHIIAILLDDHPSSGNTGLRPKPAISTPTVLVPSTLRRVR